MPADDPRTEQDLKQVLRKRAARSGDKIWIQTGERAYSYAYMDRRSNRLARGFANIGIAAGETVLIMLPDTVDYVLIWCALSKLGAVEVPVNTHYRGGILTHIINDSLAGTLICDRRFLDRVADVSASLRNLQRIIVYSQHPFDDAPALPDALASRCAALRYEALAEESAEPLEDGPRYCDLMGVMYTSGTTGPSKGGMITHAHAWEYAKGVVEMLELEERDIYYATLPFFHIAGQWALVYACCLVDATAVLKGAFSLDDYWQDVRRFEATTSFLLGAMANFLYNQPPRSDDADNPMERMLVVPLIPEIETFKRRFGCRVSTTWGGTEMNCPTRSGFTLVNSKTCGRVSEDRYEVVIVDADDNEVPPGVPGEALVRAREPWIMSVGYWNHPEWTVRAWRNLWYHTGDMLMRDAEGNLYFVDRTKDAIRRRGENISSMEVENEINQHPAVLECAVVPVESEYAEQEVRAVIVPRPGESLDPEALVRFLEPRMAYFMVPRYIDVVSELPKTPTGKIQKFPLREQGLCDTTWDREAAGVTLKR